MAAVASPSALLIGWAITGVGILFLAFAMLLLTRIRPDLDGGIFTYAREGFGELIGFCSASGILAVRGDRQRLLSGYRLFGAQFFTDTPELRLFGDGNTGSLSLARRFCCGSSTFWSCAVSRRQRGLTGGHPRQASAAGRLCRARRPRPFSWIRSASILAASALGVPVWEQVKNTMLITLWVFIGVEGR